MSTVPRPQRSQNGHLQNSADLAGLVQSRSVPSGVLYAGLEFSITTGLQGRLRWHPFVTRPLPPSRNSLSLSWFINPPTPAPEKLQPIGNQSVSGKFSPPKHQGIKHINNRIRCPAGKPSCCRLLPGYVPACDARAMQLCEAGGARVGGAE